MVSHSTLVDEVVIHSGESHCSEVTFSYLAGCVTIGNASAGDAFRYAIRGSLMTE
jgi:hypothetical protein